MKEIVIDRGITQSRVGIYVNGILERLYIDDTKSSSLSGNIYLGRIQNVVRGMNAAFINIGLAKNALLHFDDVKEQESLREGNSILVQIIREASGGKGPRVSSRISIPGKFIILHPGEDAMGVSRKIEEDSERNRLKDIASSLNSKGSGVVIRTEAAGVESQKIEDEYNYLEQIWTAIHRNSEYLKPPQLLFNARDLFGYILRELVKQDVDVIYFNHLEDKEFFKNILLDRKELKHIKLLYDEFNFSYFKRLENDIESLSENRVNLPAGGFIIVDRTEAAVIVDVNSGKTKNSNEIIFKANMEACREIYRYITLSNLSGIIIVDFINMEDKSEREQVLNELEKYFKGDTVPVKILGYTGLGLIEISRARKSKRLMDFIYKDETSGELNASFALKNIENMCLRELKQKNRRTASLAVSTYLRQELETNYSDFIESLKNIYEIELKLIHGKCNRNYSLEYGESNFREVKIETQNDVFYGIIEEKYEDKNGCITLKIKKI